MPARSVRRLSRTAAGTLAILAVAAPMAAARPAIDSPADIKAHSVAAPARTVAPSADAGFEWGDAAIGAGGATLALMLGAAGAMSVSRRHQHIGTVR